MPGGGWILRAAAAALRFFGTSEVWRWWGIGLLRILLGAWGCAGALPCVLELCKVDFLVAPFKAKSHSVFFLQI